MIRARFNACLPRASRDAGFFCRVGRVMNYGLYLSATGVLTNSYRQDVIANNLANAETVGFKRNLAPVPRAPRREPSPVAPACDSSDRLFEPMTGGLLASPTAIDPRRASWSTRAIPSTWPFKARAISRCRTAARRASPATGGS